MICFSTPVGCCTLLSAVPQLHPVLVPGISDLGLKYKTGWPTSDRPHCYRRGLYIDFKRTKPYPILIMFDGPESNLCQAMRNQSNTPLQALTTLNDPVFVECAQSLGYYMSAMPGSDEFRVLCSGRLCITRWFDSREVNELLWQLNMERQYYAKQSAAAAALVGQFGGNDVPNSEIGAWIATARTILNLDEFITRE